MTTLMRGAMRRLLPSRRLAALSFSLGATVVASAQTVAITGGTVYPVSGPKIEHGTVLIRNGKVVAVGASVSVPSDAERVDATGKWVTPGLINPSTILGLTEIEFGGPASDFQSKGSDGVAAAFRAWEGLNPRSVLLAPAREEGVTSFVPAPGNNTLIAGQLAILDLNPGTLDSMIVRAPVAMLANAEPAQGNGAQDEAAAADVAGATEIGSRGEVLLRLRELFDDTRDYARRKAEYDRGQSRQYIARRSDLEAMIPVVQGKLPLVLTADRASDIEAGIRLTRQYGVKLVIASGSEAWMVAKELAAAKVPVLAGAMNNIPTSFSALGSRQENVALLRQAGVTVALVGNAGGGGEEQFNVRNLRFEAGNAVAYGATWDDALRAVTLSPAEIFGVADRVGSLRPGAEANVVVWSGDPFEFSTKAEAVFVRGKRLVDTSRQDQLTKRYQALPPKYSQP